MGLVLVAGGGAGGGGSVRGGCPPRARDGPRGTEHRGRPGELPRPEPLPEAQDVEGLAEYWKQHFNTPRGAGTVTRFVAAYREHGVRSES